MTDRDSAGSSFAPLLLVEALGTVVLFLFAVRLLGTATTAATPVLERLSALVVVGDASALGLGWLGAYVLANGSVVAALALSLFAADLLSPPQLFLMVAGSRLGGAAVVVVVGAFDYFQKERFSFRKSVSMGVLTLLLTHSIYLPVTALGYLASPFLRVPLGAVARDWVSGGPSLTLFGPVTVAVTSRVGPVPAFLLALAVLFGSMRLFDRVLARVDAETLRERVFARFSNPWTSFAVGLVVTGVTTSVAFSLGVVVPLYNRGYVKRAELVPYVLGANLGTLLDTLVVAVVLESPLGVAVVLELLALATLATLAALVAGDAYVRSVAAVDDRLLGDPRAFAAFVLSLVLAPAVLVVASLLVG